MADTDEQTADAWAELGQGFAHEAVVVAEDAAIEVDEDRAHRNHLRRLEDKVLEHSLRIVADAMHFDEVDDPGPAEAAAAAAALALLQAPAGQPVLGVTPVTVEAPIPQAWIDELGEEGAKRRMRMARAAWKPIKDSAVGFKIATQVFTGIVKARATEKGRPVELNIGVVQLSAPLPEFERRKVLPK